MDRLWLPEGAHWDLNIHHRPLEDSGSFAAGGHKGLIHTTESSRDSASAIWRVLRDKRAAPHVIFGYDPDTRFPVVIQCVPFNRAARALAHPEGTPETNRGGVVIQAETCGRAQDSHRWSDNYYRGMANMWALILRRVNIPLTARAKFTVPANRLSSGTFVAASGFLGHGHVPNNDHWDPGLFDIGKFLHLVKLANQQGGLNLKPVKR